MGSAYEIDIGDVVDAQRIRAFNIKLFIWSFLLLLTDGYDFAAAGFAAPSLIKAWNIQNLAVLGPVFSASLVGIALGAPLLGYLADRVGRKKVLILGTVIFSIFTFAAAWADGVSSFLVLRFFAGVGLGGVMPVTITLNAEYMPRRVRATLVSLVFVGLPVGVGIPGLVTAFLVPYYGWPIIFLIGGVVPLVIAACVGLTIPESAKFLVLRADRHRELAAVVRLIAPGLDVPADAQFVMREDGPSGKAGFRELFTGDLAVKTPLIWLLFATVGMVLYFIQTWLPTLLGTVGVPPAHAAIATTLYQAGAIVGTLAIGLPVDRYGAWPLTVAIALASPVVALLGTPGLGESTLMGLLFVSGALILGAQNGLNAFTSMVYPAAVRAKGVGTALAIARVGSISGAVIGGFLIAAHLSLEALFLYTATPMIVASLAACFLSYRYRTRKRQLSSPPQHSM